MMLRLLLVCFLLSMGISNVSIGATNADDLLEEVKRLTALKRVELADANRRLRGVERGLSSARRRTERRTAEIEEGTHRRDFLDRRDRLALDRAELEAKKHLLHAERQLASFERLAKSSPSSLEEYRRASVSTRREVATRELEYNRSLPPSTRKYKSPDLLPEDSYRVALSVDGGGMKGLMPLRIMQSLEDFLGGRHLSDYVDCLGGTSIGGIIALGYSVKEGDGPRYHSDHLAELFTERGAEVFPKKRGLGLLSSKYSPRGLEALLVEYFGDNTLRDVIKPVVATALSIDKSVREFGTHEATKEERENYYLRDVARATSAAPTFFPAAEIRSCCGTASGTYVDGGLYCNNPGLVTLSAMQGFYEDATDVNSVVLSFGTGVNPRENWISRDAGAVGIVPILNGFMAGASGLVERQLTDRLKERHMRVQFTLDKEMPLDTSDGFDLELMGMSALMEETCVEPVARFLGENRDRRL